jgi:hypothetical protein
VILALPEGVARAEGLSAGVVLGIVYVVLTIIAKLKQAGKKPSPPSPRPAPRQRPSQQPQQHKVEYPSPAESRRPRLSSSSSAPERPNTQTEAVRLEELLRGLGQLAGLPDEEGPLGRRSQTRLPEAEEAEERESLEVDREPVSLEAPEPSRTRVEVDQDEGAEALVQRRIQAAMARNRPLSVADHKEFDQKLRVTAAKAATVKLAPSIRRLRNAIIWREVLGPPLGLRDRQER